MKETLRKNLVDLAASYSSATGASYASIGQLCMKDNTFFSRIMAGSGFNIGTFDRVVEWFSDNWPVDCAWPDGVERPASAKDEVAA